MKNLILRTRFLALVLVIIASGCIGIPESPTGNNYETIDKAPIVVCSSGCNFNSIQDAIDSAKVGDIVEVNSGTYYENVEINKRIILRGRDTGNGFPIIDAWGHGSAITLKTNGIVLEKIIAINSSDSTDYSPSGISVYSNDNVIRFNRIRGGHNGIYLSNADNNRIEGNDVENCEYGVGLYQSNDNKISKNKISNNLWNGIEIFTLNENNIIENNEITSNGYSSIKGSGIQLEKSGKKNIIQGNILRYNCESGIDLADSSNNIINGNKIEYNQESGIHLGTTIASNEGSGHNIISDNIINNNANGIYIEKEGYENKENMIYNNKLENNTIHNAFDGSGINQWNKDKVGNYYSDFDEPDEGCIDLDNNGLCDISMPPHIIPGEGNIDRYPLRSWGKSDI